MDDLSDRQLRIISTRISSEIGLFFPEDRWRDLKRGILGAAVELGCVDADHFVERLIASPADRKMIEVLARHLTTGETYFFREKQVFLILKEKILPGLIRSRSASGKIIRIWCAGCSSGEEPYSIAILLKQMLPDIHDWNITIRATDINIDALLRAREGIFGEWSFRDTDPELRNSFFTTGEKGRFVINPEIKKMVSFAYLNLVSDPYPELANNTNAMDIIFCRNVLMYFSPEQVESVTRRFHHALLDGGWFVTSVTETSLNLTREFSGINLPEAIVYRKVSRDPDEVPHTGPASRSVTVIPKIPRIISARAGTRSVSPAVTVPVAARSVPAPKKPEPVSTITAALEHYKAGRYAEVASACEVLPDREKNTGTMILLTRAYANQGQLDLAENWCRKAIASDRINPETHYLLASILQELGREEEAAESLQRVLYLDHTCILAHYDLGNISLRQGDKKKACLHFRTTEKILAKMPDNAVVPYSEGLNAAKLLRIIKTTVTRVGTMA